MTRVSHWAAATGCNRMVGSPQHTQQTKERGGKSNVEKNVAAQTLNITRVSHGAATTE